MKKIKKKPLKNKKKPLKNKKKPLKNKKKPLKNKKKPLKNKKKPLKNKKKPLKNKKKPLKNKKKPLKNKKKPLKNKKKPLKNKKKTLKSKKKFLKNIFKKKDNKNNNRSIILKLVKFQNKITSDFKFIFSINLKKNIKKLFNITKKRIKERITEKIKEYKIAKKEEKKLKKLKELENLEKEKVLLQRLKKQEEELKTKLKEQALKTEIKLARKRNKDIKLFLRQEQAIVRKEQAGRQRQFLRQIQLEKQIEKFRIREVKELEKLEKISLKEKREDYVGLQERIEKLKEKYRVIRDQKIRERVEALGVKIQGDEDRETLLQKEKDYTIARQKIEFSLESFYRSANSLVFQLNKKYITRYMSIFRCIDRRFETGEIFIKWDEAEDADWLLLIYIKDNSPNEGIIIEDKCNPEKNLSYEFKLNEIFKASDIMVDSLTQLISRTRKKKN